MPRSARPYRARRYTGSRATVASGIPADGPLISGGIALVCIAAALLGLSSWFGLLGLRGLGLPVRQTTVRLCAYIHKVADVGPDGVSRNRLGQGGSQAGLAHPPEVDLHPVDQRHRDLVPVLAQVLR